MRATRAYIAGFGTVGSVLAGCALLFVVASALVAFRGWPEMAAQSAPSTLRLQAGPATAPAARAPPGALPRCWSRRPHATAARPVLGGAPGTRGPRRSATLVRGGSRLSSTASGHVAPVSGATPGDGRRASPAPTSAGAPAHAPAPAPTSASGQSGSGSDPGGTVVVKVGGAGVKGGGSNGVSVTVPATPVTGPVTVSVPSGTTAPVGGVVNTVGATAGNTVAGVGAAAGNTVGGSVGRTVTKVTGAAGSAVSQLGGTAGGLLGG